LSFPRRRKSNKQQHMQMFYVYILTNKNHTTLYIGMTNNLKRRLIQHKKGTKNSFSVRYNLDKLYFETTKYVLNAIKREK